MSDVMEGMAISGQGVHIDMMRESLCLFLYHA
jgi:hypothetical protein